MHVHTTKAVVEILRYFVRWPIDTRACSGATGAVPPTDTPSTWWRSTPCPATRTPQMSWTPGVHAYLHLEDTLCPRADEICPERAKWERACARINEGRRHGLYRGASNIDSHGGCYGRFLLYSRRTCCWRNHVEVYNQLPFHFITARALAHHFHLLHYKETINWASCWPG